MGIEGAEREDSQALIVQMGSLYRLRQIVYRAFLLCREVKYVGICRFRSIQENQRLYGVFYGQIAFAIDG